MYGYAFNNPLKFIDPTGLACVYAGADNGTAADYNDPTNYIDDNNGGQSCADAFASPPQQLNVTDNSSWLDGLDFSSWGDSSQMSSATQGGLTFSGVFNLKGFAEIAHQAYCGLAAPLTTASKVSNRTVGVGVGGNAGVGFILGIAASAGIQAVADRDGNVGIAISIGGNPGYGVFGAGALGGVQGSVSTAANIEGLKGFSLGAGGSAGPYGLDVAGSSSGVTATGTFGIGIGTKGAGLSMNYTFLPISVKCR